jgi:hypothetical protein
VERRICLNDGLKHHIHALRDSDFSSASCWHRDGFQIGAISALQ